MGYRFNFKSKLCYVGEAFITEHYNSFLNLLQENTSVEGKQLEMWWTQGFKARKSLC